MRLFQQIDAWFNSNLYIRFDETIISCGFEIIGRNLISTTEIFREPIMTLDVEFCFLSSSTSCFSLRPMSPLLELYLHHLRLLYEFRRDPRGFTSDTVLVPFDFSSVTPLLPDKSRHLKL